MIRFGPLFIQHLNEILAIENRSFQEPWSRDGFFDILQNPTFSSLGVFLEDKLVGYCVYYVVVDELHVMNVAVNPEFRKQSFATKLLEQIHTTAKERKIRFCFLEVRATNQAAQHLYKKLGYQIQGRRIGYYPNQEDALLMLKEL